MNWFYALNGQQAGPVDDAELDRLVQNGTIAQSTLVWYSGMAQWQPYAEARRTTPGSATVAAVPGEGQAQCSQCGQILPADEIVRVENYNVCAVCKPMLLQKLREGVSPAVGALGLASVAVYGGFWIRLGAAILDGLILIPLYVAYGFALYFFTDLHNLNFNDPQAINQFSMVRVYLPFNLVLIALLACYSAFCISRFGGTPGKRICRLRVVYGDVGGKVSFGRALGRYAAKNLPSFVPVLGLIYRIVDALFIAFHGSWNRAQNSTGPGRPCLS